MEENKPAHTTENSGWIEVNCRGGVYFLKKNPKKKNSTLDLYTQT